MANASIAADGASVTLSTWNVSVAVTIAFNAAASDCSGAVFSAEPLALGPPLVPTPGLSVIKLAASSAQACSKRVVVMGVEPLLNFTEVRPISAWAQEGPLF